jgi:hypothetical protein
METFSGKSPIKQVMEHTYLGFDQVIKKYATQGKHKKVIQIIKKKNVHLKKNYTKLYTPSHNMHMQFLVFNAWEVLEKTGVLICAVGQ